MILTIYDRLGNPRVELSPDDNSTQAKGIQSDNVLTLTFKIYDHVTLDVDDYIDFEGERYWLTEQYRPKQVSTMEWAYNLQLYGIESLLRNILVIKTVDDEYDPVFTLTAPPREHVAMIVKCLNNSRGNVTDWKVGQVDGKENIVIDYNGKYCDEALREIAEKVGAEYWTEGQTVNVCRCEHGEPITLGYNNGLLSMDPGKAANVKFYTRLWPVGSSRNIDPEEYGYSRLQLPEGQKYVQINADKYCTVDHYEAAAFSDIYPRRTGTVSNVRPEIKKGSDGNDYVVYYFSDSDLPFDPNDYMIANRIMRVSFQEGSELAGLGAEESGTYYFEVNYNATTREFELITIWPYDNGMQLPGGKLIPKAGDKYILWNLRMPVEYYRLAEAEFMEAVNKYNADHAVDISVFRASTDHVWVEDNEADLFIGRRVRLESEQYFPGIGFRDSRITKITRKINLPSQMDIEIGDVMSRTSKAKMTDDISAIKSYAQSIGASISLPDIIRASDSTVPTDNNLFSARRSMQEFASKKHDDRTPYKLSTDRAFEVGRYLAGVSGGIFGMDDDTGDSFAEVARLYVRVKAFFEELTVIKARVLAGKQYITPGGGVKCVGVAEVRDDSGAVIAWHCYFLSEQDGEKTETKIVAGDQAIAQMFNASEGTSNKVSNHRYWRLVTAVDNDAYTDSNGNHYGYVELSAADCEPGSDAPQAGDEICQLGNRNDPDRQAAMVFSTVDADAPSVKLYGGIDSFTLAGKAIVSFGQDPATGKVYFRLGGDGDRQYLEYRQGRGLVVSGAITSTSVYDDGSGDDKTLGDVIGAAVADTDVLYASHTSATDAPALPTVGADGSITVLNGWATAAPSWQAGRYIWQVTYVRKGDGSASFSTPSCISGRDGRGLASITEQYYLSTSRTALAGGSWSDQRQPWIAGRYYWTRSKITYTDGSVEYTAGVCVTGETGAAGTSAMIRYSATGGGNASEWHPTPQPDDRYMQTSADGGLTWSPAYRFVGADGAGYAPNIILESTGCRFGGWNTNYPDALRQWVDTDADGTGILRQECIGTGGFNNWTMLCRPSSAAAGNYLSGGLGSLKDGKEYTLSFDYMSTCEVQAYLESRVHAIPVTTFAPSAAWTRAHITCKVNMPDTNDYISLNLRMRSATAKAGDTASFRRICLVEGAATDWVPAASEMVGRDGAYPAFQWAKNNDADKEPASGWQGSPVTALAGEYVWMRTGTVVPPATSPATWGKAVRLTGDQGRDGEDVYRLTLDNEMDGVICDASGNVTGAYPTCNARVFRGATLLSAGVTYSIAQVSGIHAVISQQGAVALSNITADRATVTIRAVTAGLTLDSVMTVTKVRPGAGYTDNLLRDSEFRQFPGAWEIGSDMRTTVDNTHVIEGRNSVRIHVTGTTTDGWRGPRQYYRGEVSPGEVFTASIWVYCEDLSLFTQSPVMELWARGADNSRISAKTVTIKPTKAGEWQQFRVAHTMPEGAACIELFPWVSRNGTLWLSSPKLERGDNPSPVWTPNSDELVPQSVTVNSDSQVFTYEGNFATLVGASTIDLTATTSGIGSPVYQWSYKTPSMPAFTDISGATAATYTLAHNAPIWGTAKSLTLRCTSGGMHDEVTIAKVSSGSDGTAGKDAYTVLLTNESHTFAGGVSAAEAASTVCEVIAYKGNTRVAASIGNITGQLAGKLTATVNNQGTASTNAKFTVNVTTALTNANRQGVLTVPVTVDGKVFTKEFSWSVSYKGDAAVIHRLSPSPDIVARDFDGTLSHTEAKCSVYKVTGSAPPVLTAEKTLRYRRLPDGLSGTLAHSSGTSAGVPLLSDTTMVIFELYNGTSYTDADLLDRQSVQVVTDARDIELGGSNLLPYTNHGTRGWSASVWNSEHKADKTGSIKTGSDAATRGMKMTLEGGLNTAGTALYDPLNTVYQGMFRIPAGTLQGGKRYMLSMTLSASATACDIEVSVNRHSFTSVRLCHLTQFAAPSSASQQRRLELPFTTPSGTTLSDGSTTNRNFYATQDLGINIYIKATGTQSIWRSLTVSDLQLEQGNVATAYKPSADDMDYLTEALRGASKTKGGLFLSSQIRLGEWDTTDPANPVMTKVLAGLSGISMPHERGGGFVLWGGGEPKDAANYNDNTAATSGIFLDGTAYFSGNAIRLNKDHAMIGDSLRLDEDGMKLIKEGETRLQVTNLSVSDFSQPSSEAVIKMPSISGLTFRFTADIDPETATGLHTIRAITGGDRIPINNGKEIPDNSVLNAGIVIQVNATQATYIPQFNVYIDLYNSAGTLSGRWICQQERTDSGAGITMIFSAAMHKNLAKGTYNMRIWLGRDNLPDEGNMVIPPVDTALTGTITPGLKDCTILAPDGFLTTWQQAAILAKKDSILLRVGDSRLELSPSMISLIHKNYGFRVSTWGIMTTSRYDPSDDGAGWDVMNL